MKKAHILYNNFADAVQAFFALYNIYGIYIENAHGAIKADLECINCTIELHKDDGDMFRLELLAKDHKVESCYYGIFKTAVDAAPYISISAHSIFSSICSYCGAYEVENRIKRMH